VSEQETHSGGTGGRFPCPTLEGRWDDGRVIVAGLANDEIVFTMEDGEIPAPRKRDTLAREAELITLIFKGAPPSWNDRSAGPP
jgi:hypothetical protein